MLYLETDNKEKKTENRGAHSALIISQKYLIELASKTTVRNCPVKIGVYKNYNSMKVI